MTLITKARAQVRLKGWSDFAASVKGDPGAPVHAAIDALENVIALHEWVERLTDAGTRALALLRADGRGDTDIAMSLADSIRETTQTCAKCGGQMNPGIATGQTYTAGSPDFGPDDEISTLSAGGPGVVIQALKCEKCGWSVTK